MIVHKIRFKSDPIFLRKVKSADRDLDEMLNWNPLDREGLVYAYVIEGEGGKSVFDTPFDRPK